MRRTLLRSAESFTDFIRQSTLDEFGESAAHFSYAEMAETLLLLSPPHAAASEMKLKHLMGMIDSPHNLKCLGEHFATAHFLKFVGYASQHALSPDALNSILAGLHPEVFSRALSAMAPPHLRYLEQIGWAEPLQYHLTQFLHEGEALQRDIGGEAERFVQRLAAIDPNTLSCEEWEGLLREIRLLKRRLTEFIKRSEAALAIAWSNDRIDLIEKLGSLHELLQHQLFRQLGHPSSPTLRPAGLYLAMEEGFSKIFDATLQDDDAAMEGLTRLSIWSLKDYWDLGLLPRIHDEQELEPNPEECGREEAAARRRRLLFAVQEQLKELQIETVGDLKKRHLFSRELLNAHILKARRHKDAKNLQKSGE